MTLIHLPYARIPVRGRTNVPSCASSETAETVVTALLLAGVVTSGTVMVREPLPVGGDVARRIRASVASTGSYVVSSADGLTATTRATAGELPQFGCTIPAHVLPLYAVAATRAAGECVLQVADGPAPDTAVLTPLGITARRTDEGVVVSPGLGDICGVIDHGGEVPVALASLLAALLQPGLRMDPGPLDEIPGFLDLWTALLGADEYLLPGSALVPADYVERSSSVGSTPPGGA